MIASPARLPAARILAVLAASSAAVAVAAAPALARPAGGTVGSPQPELTQFRTGPAGGPGSAGMLANGSIVLASLTPSGAAINACVVALGGRSCADSVTLHAHAGDTFSPTPQVLVTGPTDFSIVASDCCHLADGVLAFSSTDGGATYVGPTEAGSIPGVTTGTVAGGQLVVADAETSTYQIQAFPPNPAGPASAAATPDSHIAGDTALATYKNGVLSAQDDLTSTYVYYAAAGINFSASASYHHVATIKNQDTVAASGAAVLTAPGGSITGKDRLWFFNGKTLAGNHKVPDTKLGDDGYFAMKDVRGTVYVFFLGRRNHYDLYEESTRNGRTWTPLVHYASAIKSEDLVPVLNGIGAGLVFEAQSPKPLLAQPIMVPQRVHVTLLRTHVSPGHGTKLTGSAAPRLDHQLVTLEVERHGRWYRVKTTHESKTGSFSFSVPGVTHTYRVVVADKPGLYQYGYSNSVKLTA